MFAFDPESHTDLLPFRECLKNWWDNRPSDVIGLALYGSRAKNCAEQYSDWDIVIFTSSENPDEDAICRDLPRVYDRAPIHALCESIDTVKSEAEYGGSVMSAIAEQGVSLFGMTVPFQEDTIKHPSYSLAETLFSSTLEALKGFLSEANIRFLKKKSRDKDATTHSTHAAEYLVKAFMCVRGINYFYVHDVKALCAQIEEEIPDDPLLKQFQELDGFTAKGHTGPYRLLHLPSKSLEKTTERIYRVLALLPRLAIEIFAGRDAPMDTKNTISDKLLVLQKSTSELEDTQLQKRFQSTLSEITEFFE